MKRIVLTATLACCLMAAPVYAGELRLGGWQTTTDTTIDDKAQAAFDAAYDGDTKTDLEPVDLLATQIVSGTNYCFLCRSAAGYSLVYVYEDLQGDASITSIQDIVFGEDNTDESAGTVTEQKDEYAIGETWTVDGQWELTVDAVEETDDRNEYADTDPAAVYIVTFTYKNLGYEDDIMDGLFFVMDDQIVDAGGKMGYSYPGDVSMYPQETPIGASCTGQVCIGVDNPGSFKVYVDQYDGNEEKQKAVFAVDVD